MIYFIQAGETVKIGWTKDKATLDRRVSTLQCGHPSKLVVLRTMDAPRWAEAWLHGFFAGLRLAGEWFKLRDDMLTVEVPSEKPQEWQTGSLRSRGMNFVMRADPELYAGIDHWRTLWPDSPSRAEVIRRLVRGEKPPAGAR